MPSTEPVPPPETPARAPTAPRRPHVLALHGQRRVDDWYWLAEREDPAVLAYLEAENAYADAQLAPAAALAATLFDEIRRRSVESDAGAPLRDGPWWWWTRTVEGAQYELLCRRADPERTLAATTVLADARLHPGGPAEQVVLDQNALAAGHDYFALGVLDVSPDQQVLAYATDVDGSERYQLRFRDIAGGVDLPDRVDDVSYGSAWAADSAHFFYVRTDAAMRPHQVWVHRLGRPVGEDRLVHEEPDERFFVSVGLSRTRRRVVIESASKTTSESWWLDADDPAGAPTLVWARAEGREYDVEDAGDGTWLVRTNAAASDGTPATNFAVYRLPHATPPERVEAVLEPVLPHRSDVTVEAVDAFAGHLVVTERAGGLVRLCVIRRSDGAPHVIAQPEPVHHVSLGANPEFATTTLRVDYTSLTTPPTSIDYDMDRRDRAEVRQTPVRGGFSPTAWHTERLWADAPDGTAVPISLVARAGQRPDGSAACLLVGYGAYEISLDPVFSVARLNLLERGVVFAVAHVRGGGEMGRSWYEQGRLAHKEHTFGDFVACAEHLVATGWAAPGRLAIRGGSAGGLLVGTVTNRRPELWRAVVAEVPFVDVVTTMCDPSLPLTVTEWEEWGDPLHDPDAYQRMLAYSPYDGVVAQDYPAMFVTAGLNDPRVGYWEPAKWVARLRATRTDDRPLLLRTELGAGHQGPSGRYDVWRDEARVQAFVLRELGAA